MNEQHKYIKLLAASILLWLLLGGSAAAVFRMLKTPDKLSPAAALLCNDKARQAGKLEE